MRIFILLILGIALFGGCKTSKGKKISFLVFDESLKFNNNTLKNMHSNSRSGFKFLCGDDRFCKLENDTLKFVFGVWWGTGLQCNISKNNIDALYTYGNCTTQLKYPSSDYLIKLNKENYKVGDSIIIDIYYKGICKADSHYLRKTDTVTIIGKAKLAIRNAEFNVVNLFEEQHYNEFLQLLKQKPDTITKLDLSQCGFKQIPKEILLFKNLQELVLDDNDLSKADFSLLSQLKYLKIINLQRCKLNDFPKSTCSLQNLENIDVFQNNIKEIPNEFYSLVNIKEIQFSSNPLQSLSPKIANLKKLESIETSNTNILTYPNEMVALKKLKEIYCNDTMKYIPKSLRKLTPDTEYYK